MLPLAALLPLLRVYWKPVAAGLAVLAASAILVGGCQHYRRMVASNAVLEAQNEAASQALKRWEASQAERTRREAAAARIAHEARAEMRELHEAFSETKTPADLVARRDVARLFGVLSKVTALEP
jgi:hypothetical protein